MPKVVDRAQRRQEVLEATWRVICRAGIDAVTVREIAAELASSTGTVSHYFRDKDEVLLSALRYCATRTGERMLAILQNRTGMAALRALLLEALPLDEQRRTEWSVWLAFWARGLTAPSYRSEQHQRYAEYQAVVEHAIRGAQGAGDLPDDLDPTDEAVRLIAFIDGLGVRAMLDPDLLTTDRITHFLDAHLLTLHARRSQCP
jgi:AcrR family transcriptional regulator